MLRLASASEAPAVASEAASDEADDAADDLNILFDAVSSSASDLSRDASDAAASEAPETADDPASDLSQYELERLANIERNEGVLERLGLKKKQEPPTRKRKKREPKYYGTRDKHYSYNGFGMPFRPRELEQPVRTSNTHTLMFI